MHRRQIHIYYQPISVSILTKIFRSVLHLFAVIPPGLIEAAFPTAETKRLVVAHEVIVVLREREQVRVDQKPRLAHVEGREHLADVGDEDTLLVEDILFFTKQRAVSNGCVDICSRVVIQADHVALGEEVKKNGGQEGKEADDSTESSLHGEALASESRVEEDLRHDEKTGSRRAVRKQLHSWQKKKIKKLYVEQPVFQN